MASATAVAVALAAAVIARPLVTTMVVVFAIVVAGNGDIGAPIGDDNGGCFPGFFSPIGALSRGLEHIGAPPWGIEVVVGTPPGAAVEVRQSPGKWVVGNSAVAGISPEMMTRGDDRLPAKQVFHLHRSLFFNFFVVSILSKPIFDGIFIVVFSIHSPTSWKYDVFLSFRGADTRNTIVDHLYSSLVQHGIETFKDDEELPRGETIHPSLLKAIEDSQIAVVVFSENYANSSWCLQELEHIMKCKVERGQIVIPIFYHIDPSEVRKQENKYGEAFAKYEAESKNVESWRKTLFDAGNLSGLVAEGPETIFIKDIVSTISQRLCVAIPSDNEDLVGIENRLQALKAILAIGLKGVLMVGIWGIGGGGKTTLAYALYDEISGKFDGSCFIENVREESNKRGLKELQKEILSCLLKQKKEDLCGDIRMLIKSRLRRKRVLLVLDDVDDATQLEALAGSNNWFNDGSRIIITTRDQHILPTSKVNVIYEIDLLNHNDAMKLFRKHALCCGNHIEDFDRLSKEVVSYAGGLPLALKVLGSFLYDKNKSEWVSALARLKDIPDGKILEQLKISYDGLEPVVKELFLDIVCFFRGEKKDEAMVIFEACGRHPKIGVRTLIEKALITVTEEGDLDMHDLIQEMGHYIVRGTYPRNPKKHSRVWRQEDVATIFATPTEASTVMFKLALNFDGFLVIIFRQRHCQEIFNQQNFLIYDWRILPNLKVLDLSGSAYLISTPDFQGLPRLERIKLNYCFRLTHIHPSISNHETLVSVELAECTVLEIFPPISGMKKLETLKVSWCYRLCNFPEIQMYMENMVEIYFKGNGIKVAPSSIKQYCTNLLFLDLGHTESLVCIEGFPSSLMKLNLESCPWINGDISYVLCELSNLQELNLSRNDFAQFHCSFLQLHNLKFLALSECKNLIELPDLPESIAVLEAWQCDKLRVVDLPTNLRWLWRISLSMTSIAGDIGRKVQSMLQGNAIKDYSISLSLYADMPIRDIARTLMLELPDNWYNEFSGFLICIHVDPVFNKKVVITIKDMMAGENEDVLKVSDGTSGHTRDTVSYLYISFGSLRHTSWWKSKHTTVSFSIDGRQAANLKVELVPGRNKGDSIERSKGTTSSSKFWDKEPINVKRDSESCIEIQWDHGDADMANLFRDDN
ncbi:hypothetical protein OSB04_010784 [Centaurea solstitialis]|uniref:TIR domain-containing protein n=1 Tax=Centaurea solstitialis TaxID=347529 RepID=A0AA38T875_9ASTR|nr:hypothetical protein OSB04_010784 [Centaurea solstitialis]